MNDVIREIAGRDLRSLLSFHEAIIKRNKNGFQENFGWRHLRNPKDIYLGLFQKLELCLSTTKWFLLWVLCSSSFLVENPQNYGIERKNERSLQLLGALTQTRCLKMVVCEFWSIDRTSLFINSHDSQSLSFGNPSENWRCRRRLRRMTRKWSQIATAPCGIGKRLPLRYHRACPCSFVGFRLAGKRETHFHWFRKHFFVRFQALMSVIVTTSVIWSAS